MNCAACTDYLVKLISYKLQLIVRTMVHVPVILCTENTKGDDTDDR